MDVTVEQLRKQYERFSDEALRDAYEKGEGTYVPRAWLVITEEMTRRELITPRPDGGTPLPKPESLTEDAALRLVHELLESGLARAGIALRLRDRGMTDADIERVVALALEKWRAEQEQRASAIKKRGAMWAAGGLVVSLWSYSIAAQSGGGTYFITYGAMLYGVVRFVEGVMLSQRARQR